MLDIVLFPLAMLAVGSQHFNSADTKSRTFAPFELEPSYVLSGSW